MLRNATVRAAIQRFATATVTAILLMASAPSRATVLLDTFIPVNLSNGNLAITWNSINNLRQSLGLEFDVATTTRVTDVLAAITGVNSFYVGVEQATTTSEGIVPNSSFVYETIVTNPSATNLSLTGLDWVLGPGSYFLVAQSFALDNGNGSWGYGISGQAGNVGSGIAAVTVNNSPWFHVGTLAARINGTPVTPTAVPEPQTWTMVAFGALIAGLARRTARATHRRAGIHGTDSTHEPNG